MKIVTHAGTHHADEVLACAVLMYFKGYNFSDIERTYDKEKIKKAQESPEVWVLDIGLKRSRYMRNFDHHQNAELPATNLMVLRHVMDPGPLRSKLEEYLFNYVDKVDRGVIVEGKDIEGVPTFNSIIRAFNAYPNGFENAVSVAYYTFSAMVAQAKKAVEDEARWNKEVDKFGRYAVSESDDPIAGWHEMAEKEGVYFLVTPNKRGGWQIITRDSAKWPIPEDNTQTFLHNSKFIAAYPSKDHAIGHAMLLDTEFEKYYNEV